MSDNFRDALWFAFSLVLAYYTIATVNFFFEVAAALLKVMVAEAVVTG